MSSDLTFFTNEPGRSLRDRFHALLGEHTRQFDCLVGYFYLSGFHQLSTALEKVEKVRILIGLKTNQVVYDGLQEAMRQRKLDFVSHAEAKERLPQEILNELDQSADSPQIEEGIAKFIAWCKSGKLEIKVYPSEKIHAKVYILTFVDGLFERGHVITGSSNLSQSGLQDNLEFNVELKNRADYEFALQKFNELWADAVEVSPLYVETIQGQSPFAQFDPYHLYLKFLYEYFKDELNQPEELADAWLPGGFKKLRYQEDAVLSAHKILDEYGGVFLSDVVGLGKTYMSALLAQQLQGRTLVIAPPALIDRDNPGSWPNVFSDFRIPQAEFESLGKLDDLLRRDISRYSNVFIDEAHRFRTETTGTYEKLAQICRGKKIILVTATPLNNSPRDILSQLKLFQTGKNSTIPNVRNLEAFFSRLEKKLKGLDRKRDRDEYFRVVQENAREIREKVLKFVMVRRTRSEIANYYDTDLAAQNLKFPQVADPVPCFYQFSPQEDAIFSNTIELLTQKFTYARYAPLTYYTGELPEQELTGQRNLARFMKVLLVKRLESSFHAFRLTLDRFIRSYELFIAAYHDGDVYLSKRHSARLFELLDSGDDEAVERLLEREQAERYDAAMFTPQLIQDLERDLQTLRDIRDDWKTIKRDPKWETLHALLAREGDCGQNKLILFTESKETAQYLAYKISEDVDEQALLFTGDSKGDARAQVLANFDARHHAPRDEFRILVTTEVLAEGVSLHRSNTVINYDIPWNPTRLIQRVGRVNRVDTPFDEIRTYNFFPTEQSNDLLKLKEAAEAKIQAFIEMLGADSRLLTEGEEIKSHDLFQRINSKRTITGEDEEEESELEYLKVIRAIRETQPELFDRIKRLPRKARSARLTQDSDGNSLLTYFRKGRLEKFFRATNNGSQGYELDFLTAVKLLECEPQMPQHPIGRDFYELLDRNKEAFITATLEDAALEDTPAASRDSKASADFKAKAIETDDFAKKLLGQIVFLYFLQKKGWFGVARDAAWGTGEKDYLRHLFTRKKPEENYFNDVLEPLFYDTLAREREGDYAPHFRCKIPFLNGGLFEAMGDYDWVHADLLLPDELFSNRETTKDGDTGTGILDVFDRYNFTVNEAEPLETEVAVDPEMLGKVFENLLPENLRHKGGTYYTPRVIVNYMCQQSLINYLASSLQSVSREDIETLITRGEVLREFEASNIESYKDKRLPESIRQNAKHLDRLLADITVCDPAIGSGAFPVGMMQEIVKARLTLAAVEGMPDRTAYELKRHAIENSLYGVDIDPSATEIARLRLWLSLVVDELEFEHIQPLPNLDYKIMQGNSLLEEFAGVKLFDDDLLAATSQDTEAQKTAIREEIIRKQNQLIELASKKIPSARELKAKFGKEIEQLNRQLSALSAPAPARQEEKLFRDLSTDAREKLAELKRLHKDFFEQSSPKKKKELRQKLEQLEWEFMELKLEKSDPALLKELAKHRRDNRKSYFLWKLHFVEVFQAKGGFDVVIGNPPYIRIQEIQASAPAMATYFKQKYAAAGKGNYDIYVIFIERGLSLLNKTGFLSFIQPHKFFNAQYGAPLRELIADGQHLLHVVHFGDQQIFAAATTYTCLLFLSRQPVAKCRFVKVEDFEAWSRIRTGLEGNIACELVSGDEWNFVVGKDTGLFEKLSRLPIKLEKIAERMAQGIRTSANEVYVLDIVKTKGEVITAYSQMLEREVLLEREAVSLFLQGREIKPYRVLPSGKVAIIPYSNDGDTTALIKEQEFKKKYPHTFAYLLENKAYLQNRENGKMRGANWYGFVYPKNIEIMTNLKILVPDIADRASFALDEMGQYAFTSGYGITLKDGVGESPKYILALLNSKLLDFYWKKVSTPLRGGFFRYFTQFIKQLPIRTINFSDRAEKEHHQLVVTLVDYLLFLKTNSSETQSRDQLMVSYFEQIIDALVYELYLPDEIQAAGKEFFAPLLAERLPALDEIKGDKLSGLRQIFERLFHKDHLIRQNIFFLDTIESIRIIEGKA